MPPPQASPRRLVKAAQVAEKLGIHPASVRRLADHGVMPPGVRIGASRRWDESQVDEWIAAGCPPFAAEAAR